MILSILFEYERSPVRNVSTNFTKKTALEVFFEAVVCIIISACFSLIYLSDDPLYNQ